MFQMMTTLRSPPPIFELVLFDNHQNLTYCHGNKAKSELLFSFIRLSDIGYKHNLWHF